MLKGDSRSAFVTASQACAKRLGRDDESTQKAIAYLKLHWKVLKCAFHDAQADSSSAQGLVSHCLCSRLSSRPMAWGHEGLKSMAGLREHRLNGNSVSVIDFPLADEEGLLKTMDSVKLDELREAKQKDYSWYPMPTEAFSTPKRNAHHR